MTVYYNNMDIYRDNQLNLDPSTLEETSIGEQGLLPYRASVYDTGIFSTRACPWHWHNDVEVFYVKRGALVYHTPGGVCRFD